MGSQETCPFGAVSTFERKGARAMKIEYPDL